MDFANTLAAGGVSGVDTVPQFFCLLFLFYLGLRLSGVGD
jgi:hypothetical protein